MLAYQIEIRMMVFLWLTASFCQHAALAETETADNVVANSPQAVVASWLELHRTGKRNEASALTTGSSDHRAGYFLPSKRDTGVRVERSLGDQRVAAVVTGSLDDNGENRVLLFWLVQRDGAWRINKSDVADRQVAEERLRGFLEGADVRWHVRRDALLGAWESGPCRLPGVSGLACGSQLQLGDDNRYRLVSWGPGGPPLDNDDDDVLQGNWQLVDDRIQLSHQDQTHSCRVVWLAKDLLVIETLGKGRASYERIDAAEDADQAR